MYVPADTEGHSKISRQENQWAHGNRTALRYQETYLKKTTDYAVDPMQQLYAIHGSAVHTINEGHTEGNMLSEERLADNVTSSKFDLYGQIIDYSDKTLGDYKITSSYKLMRALGYYKVDVPTGEVYKTGLKKVSQRQGKNGVLTV